MTDALSDNSETQTIRTVVFRVDASLRIGTGHVMRCLALADALAQTGTVCHFVCRQQEGSLIELIGEHGHVVHPLTECDERDQVLNGSRHADWLIVPQIKDARHTIDAIEKISAGSVIDWLIVDHYAIDMTWELPVRNHVDNILIIDDLADRPHRCDLLIDQNLYRDMDKRYDGLTNVSCHRLLGPDFCLLRTEFLQVTKPAVRDHGIQRIIVFFGGADTSNETYKAVNALLNFEDLKVDIVVGATNPNRKQIQNICNMAKTLSFHCQIDNMAELMSQADLMIGAGGINLWERCYLGLPSLVTTTADNQHEQNLAAELAGVCLLLGDKDNVTTKRIKDTISELIDAPERLAAMSKAAIDMMRNHIGIDGVIDAMHHTQLLGSIHLRDMTLDDDERVYEWRNAPHVREMMFNTAEIPQRSHTLWFEDVLKRDDVDYKIIMLDGHPIGQANVTKIEGDRCHWGFYIGETDTPKGTGTRFAERFIQYIFDTHDVGVIIGEIKNTNRASIRLHERMRFVIDQTMTDNCPHDDTIVMTLSRDDWEMHTTRER